MNTEEYLRDLLQDFAYDGMDADGARETAVQCLVDFKDLDWDAAEDMVGAMLAKEWDEMLANTKEASREATEDYKALQDFVQRLY